MLEVSGLTTELVNDDFPRRNKLDLNPVDNGGRSKKPPPELNTPEGTKVDFLEGNGVGFLVEIGDGAVLEVGSEEELGVGRSVVV
jgi:hypothetical protein